MSILRYPPELKQEYSQFSRFYSDSTREYNNKVREIINKISILDNWDNFVIFNGIKYGIPFIRENVHMENNCGGDVIFDSYAECCNGSSSFGNGCRCNNSSNQELPKIYKCLKCNVLVRL